jgi:hypothetical protein
MVRDGGRSVQRASFSLHLDNRYHAFVQNRESMSIRTHLLRRVGLPE